MFVDSTVPLFNQVDDIVEVKQSVLVLDRTTKTGVAATAIVSANWWNINSFYLKWWIWIYCITTCINWYYSWYWNNSCWYRNNINKCNCYCNCIWCWNNICNYNYKCWCWIYKYKSTNSDD